MENDIMVTDAIPAYLALPNGSEQAPAIILIHEIWGLNDHVRDVANRFAAQGYAVLAPNLFYGMSFDGKIDQSLLAEMQDPDKRDEAQKKMRDVLAPIQAPEFAGETLAKLNACFEFLLAHERVNGKIGIIGFCFGGTYSFALAAHEPRLKVSIPFYGHANLAEVPDISCPVLAFYGEKDEGLVAGVEDLDHAMKESGKQFEYVVYPNTGHAFFNDTNAKMYNAEAATDAWEKSLAFLKTHLA